MSTNRETIEVIVSGLPAIDNLARRLDVVSGKAIDVITKIAQIDESIKKLEGSRPSTAAAAGGAVGRKSGSKLQDDTEREIRRQRAAMAAATRSQDKLNAKHIQVASLLDAQKKVIREATSSLLDDVRSRRFESRKRTTDARVNRLFAAANRIGPGEGLPPALRAKQSETFGRVRQIRGQLADLEKESRVIAKASAAMGDSGGKLLAQMRVIEGAREQLSRELRSTVEELREPGRAERGRRSTFNTSRDIARKAEELVDVRGVPQSKLSANLGGARLPISEILQKASNARDRGDIQGARDILAAAKDRVSAIEKDLALEEKIYKAKQKNFADVQALERQKRLSLESLAKTESDIGAGKRVSRSAAENYAFYGRNSGGGDDGRREQLALPPARGFSAFQPLPREALLPSGGARMVGQGREFLVGPGGSRTNIPELDRLGIASMLPYDGKKTSAGRGKPSIESILDFGQTGSTAKSIFSIFGEVARDFGKNLASEIKAASANLAKGQAGLSTARGMAEAVSMRAESRLQPDFGDYSDIDKFLDGLRSTERGFEDLISAQKRSLAEYDRSYKAKRGIGGGLIDIAEGSLSPQRQFDAMGRLPGVNFSRPAGMSTANLEKVSAALAELRGGLDLTDTQLRALGRSIDKVQASYEREKERRDPNADILTRRFGPRGGQAISEGLIGGAFPLLFGQGPGASLGGLVGGAAGGFAGGMLGFGASLIGTAIGQAFDDLRQASIDSGNALRNPIEGLSKLEEMSILASVSQERLVKKLVESGQTVTAYGVLQEELNRKIGSTGIESLIEAANASDKFSRAVAEIGKQLEVAVAGPLTSFLNLVSGFLEGYNNQQRFDRAAKNASPEARERILPRLRKDAADSATAPVIDLRRIFGDTFSVESLPKQRVNSAISQLESTAPKPKSTELQQREAESRKAQQALEGGQRLARAQSIKNEAADTYRGLKQQVIAIAREQQDIFKQGFEIRKAYELQIADIRESVAQRATQIESDNKRKEIDLIVKQNEIREQGLKNAAAALQNRLAGDDLAQRLASAVDSYLSAQLSAENQLEQQKKQFELEIATLAVETEKYKIDTAKNVAKLNRETAKQIEQINLNVIRKNEDARLNEFSTQKQIALSKLSVLRQELEFERTQARVDQYSVQTSIAQAGETPYLAAAKQITAEIFNNLTLGVQDTVAEFNKIRDLSVPGRLQGVSPLNQQSVSTAAVDRQASRARVLLEQFKGLQEQLQSFISSGNITAIAGELDRIAFGDTWQQVRELNNALSESQLAFGSADNSIKAIEASYSKYLDLLKADNRLRPEQLEVLEKVLAGYKEEQIRLEALKPTLRFYTEAIRTQTQETERLGAEISNLLSPLTEQERVIARLRRSGGIGIDPEQRESIMEGAKNIDLLNRKIRQLERVKDFARSWTDAFIGFNQELLKTGNLGNSVKSWVQDIAGKSVDLVLEMSLRPMQDQLFKDLANFLGFEAPEDPALKPLNDILGSLNKTSATAEQMLETLKSIKMPVEPAQSAPAFTGPTPKPYSLSQVSALVNLPASGASGATGKLGGIGNMLPYTKGGPNINEGVGWGRGRFHAGRDLGLDPGNPIHARRSGVVTRAYSSGFGKVGGAAVVKYDDGMEGTYGHTTPSVSVGQRVSAGERIATVTTDPKASNTHLHYELRDQLGKVIEPLEYIKESLRATAGTKGPGQTVFQQPARKLIPIPVEPFVDSMEPAMEGFAQLDSSIGDSYTSMRYFSDQAKIAGDQLAAVGNSASTVTAEETKRIEALKQFGDTIGEGIKIIGSAAMIFGGIDTMKKGGTYNTLVGLSSVFGGLSGAIGKIPGFANGGRPPVNGPSWVGERGPEIWWPDQAGTIIPMDQAFDYSVSQRSGDPYAETRAHVSAARSSAERSRFETVDVSSEPLKLSYEVVKVGEMNFVTEERYRRDTKRVQQSSDLRAVRKLKNSASARKSVGLG
jgi:murein DD-endopeptidase MepM/ murein hydrolase activator NlpD